MVELHGSQCGFCTPGFVMSLFALSQNPAPEDKHAAVLDALAGNLCRCTGYRPILAVAAALDYTPDARVAEWRAALDGLPAAGDAPKNLAELDAALAAAPAAKLTAGNTDIGVGIAKYGCVPAAIISLRDVAELKMIKEHPEYLEIGAGANYSGMLPYLDKYFENFAGLVRRIGSVQIRNSGTMGGNICNASPIGDSAPCLIALNASLVLRSGASERVVAVDEFFVDYRKTLLQPGEYLKSILVPYLAEGEHFYAYKLARRFDQDISTVSGAFLLGMKNGAITRVRAAFGGMAATPVRAAAIEAALTGQACAEPSFAAAAKNIDKIFQPISDFRASAAYRLEVAAGFIHRLGAQAVDGVRPVEIWAL